MLLAAIEWQEVAAVLGGIGLSVSLWAAFTARNMAKLAKVQAEAASRQAVVAEGAHARATEPRLRIARYPDGSAKIHDPLPIVVIGDGPIEHSDWLRIEIENLRDAAADIDQVHVNEHRAVTEKASCEKRDPAKADIKVEHLDPNRGPHEIEVRYHDRDSGAPRFLKAILRRDADGWCVESERDQAADPPVP
jgi:hypothetical protein